MYSEPELHITDAHESNNFLVERRHQEMIVSIYLHWTVHTFFISHVLIPSGLNGKMIQAQEREWMCPCQSDGPGPGDACWRNADAVMLWQKMGGVAPPHLGSATTAPLFTLMDRACPLFKPYVSLSESIRLQNCLSSPVDGRALFVSPQCVFQSPLSPENVVRWNKRCHAFDEWFHLDLRILLVSVPVRIVCWTVYSYLLRMYFDIWHLHVFFCMISLNASSASIISYKADSMQLFRQCPMSLTDSLCWTVTRYWFLRNLWFSEKLRLITCSLLSVVNQGAGSVLYLTSL